MDSGDAGESVQGGAEIEVRNEATAPPPPPLPQQTDSPSQTKDRSTPPIPAAPEENSITSSPNSKPRRFSLPAGMELAVDTDTQEMSFLHPIEGTPAAAALAANASLKVSKFKKGIRHLRGIGSARIKIKSKKKKKDRFSKNFKGKKIEGIHEQYTLTIGMMLGIRVAVMIYFYK